MGDQKQKQVQITYPPIVLGADDAKLFGQNRFPKTYKKLRILGKGGCAVVHLAQSLATGGKFAIKQFPRQSPAIASGYNEIEINRLIFEEKKNAEDGASTVPQSICRFHEFIDEGKDLWLVFELIDGGHALFGSFNEIQGTFSNGERIYESVQNDRRL